MQKKKFDLSADIIQVETGPVSFDVEEDKKIARTDQVKDNIPIPKKIYFNFYVSEIFRKEFRIWCANRDINHSDGLVKIFERVKNLDDF